jgi:ATP-dependent DNA helicase PIF1
MVDGEAAFSDDGANEERSTSEIVALREAISGGESLLVCGRAGVGKSRQLAWARDVAVASGRSVVVLAPTGVAANHVGGQTVHSFFKFRGGPICQADALLTVKWMLKDKRAAIKAMSLLIVDEVSMVRSDLLAAVDMVLRRVRGFPTRPFGGVQTLLFGDEKQLPPIVGNEAEKRFLEETYGTAAFTGAPCVASLARFELTVVFRQREAEFVEALNEVREGRLGTASQRVFSSRVAPAGPESVTLTMTRCRANAINDGRLADLAAGGRCVEYVAEVTTGKKCARGGKAGGAAAGVKEGDFRCPTLLRLCLGARVMLLTNDKDERFCNGSTGTVTSLAVPSCCTGVIRVLLDGGGGREDDRRKVQVDVARVAQEKVSFSYDPATGKVGRKVEAVMTQYPMQLAWACTTHKAQGLSLDAVHVDLEGGTFSPGQAYVALSRCKSLDGLTLQRRLTSRDVAAVCLQRAVTTSL